MPGLQGSGPTSDSGLLSVIWEDFCTLLDSPSIDVPTSKLSAPIPTSLTAPGQYFFETHPQKRVIEAYCIKLALMNQLCVLVADGHERSRRSVGVISPEQVRIQFQEHYATILPIRWRACVSLVDAWSDEPPPSDDMPAEMAQGLTSIPAGANFIYTAPLIKKWPPGKTLSVTVLIQSIDPIPDDDQTQMKGLLRVHVLGEGFNARDFSDRDVFRVALSRGGNRGVNMEVWARKVDTPERGIIISGMTNAMSMDSWKSFARTAGEVRAGSTIAVYPAFLPAHDLFSCGMLLLRALLGSDEPRWQLACERLPSVVESLGPIVQGVDENDHYTIHVRVRDRLRESGHCFETGDLPDGLWWDAFVAVLRACSRVAGFSYASETSGYAPSPVRLLARDMALLARRARVELLEAGERDAMILRLCDRSMDRLVAGV